jgi:AcrR family transcriptional regulator
MSTTPMARRPGAVRSQAARKAILAAASELIARDGYDHLTIEGIAARAGVGKPTVYRWWPSKSALIAECLIDETLLPAVITPRNSGDVMADVTEWLDTVIRFASIDANALLIRSLVAAGVENPEVTEQLSHRLGATPESLEGRLAAAVADGELRPDTAVGHLTDAIVGFIILRAISRTPFAASDSRTLAGALLGGSLAKG